MFFLSFYILFVKGAGDNCVSKNAVVLCDGKGVIEMSSLVAYQFAGIIAMLQDMNSDQRLEAIFAKHHRALVACYPETEQSDFFAAVIDTFYLKQPLMFCQALGRKWPEGIDFPEMTVYLIQQIREIMEAYSTGDKGRPHELDILSVTKWLYASALKQGNLGKVNQCARLCGAKLDPFWVDNYCRRECVHGENTWERNFREHLANGLISRTGYWAYYNLGSGVYLNQLKPEHYSRESWLKDALVTLFLSGNFLTPDAEKLIELYSRELTLIMGEKKANAWLSAQPPMRSL